MAKQVRGMYWAFILYPESCDINDFIREITQYRVPYVISPLHDSDKDKDGNIKKAHFHIMLFYSHSISYGTVAEFTEKFGTFPIRVESLEGYYDYLTHDECDDSNKAIYNKADIIHGNGFNIDNYIKPSQIEINNITAELTTFIIDNNITEYCDFTKYACGLGGLYFKVCVSRTLYFNHLISSLRHSKGLKK